MVPYLMEGEPLARKSETVILIAEDEPIVRNVVRAIIQAAGYSFLVAANGEEALALSRAYPGDIHLLITDIKMPKMNGAQLAKALSAERPGIRIMAMSGAASDEILKANLKVPFLRKPFLPKEFKAKLDQILLSS
jgi:two-component system, cell cycle sensor histidine kinase and response regulator CckA